MLGNVLTCTTVTHFCLPCFALTTTVRWDQIIVRSHLAYFLSGDACTTAFRSNALWHIRKIRAELGSLLSRRTMDYSEDQHFDSVDAFSSSFCLQRSLVIAFWESTCANESACLSGNELPNGIITCKSGRSSVACARTTCCYAAPAENFPVFTDDIRELSMLFAAVATPTVDPAPESRFFTERFTMCEVRIVIRVSHK